MFEFAIYILTMSAIFGLAAVSLNLQAGSSRLLNFGQIAFVGMGAYSVAISSGLGLPWPVGMVIGVAVPAFVGALIGWLNRDLGAEYWAISTLALAELFRLVVINETWLTGGPQGLSVRDGPLRAIEPERLSFSWLALSVAILLLAVLVTQYLLRQTQFGRVVRTIREEPNLALSLGYDTTRVKVQVLLYAGALAGLAGALFAHFFAFVGPESLLALETFILWAMIVVGGMGSPWGAVIGATLVQTLYAGTPLIKDEIGLEDNVAAVLRVFFIGAILLGCLMISAKGIIPERLVKHNVGR